MAEGDVVGTSSRRDHIDNPLISSVLEVLIGLKLNCFDLIQRVIRIIEDHFLSCQGNIHFIGPQQGLAVGSDLLHLIGEVLTLQVYGRNAHVNTKRERCGQRLEESAGCCSSVVD